MWANSSYLVATGLAYQFSNYYSYTFFEVSLSPELATLVHIMKISNMN